MTSMIDRIAATLAAPSLIFDPDSEVARRAASPYTVAYAREKFRAKARLAIEAMRHPTTSMKLAGARNIGVDVAHDTYTLMVEEALR